MEEEILALNARAETLRKRLEALVQADADAFTPLAAAYGLPKETPEQQAHKAAMLAEALDGACAVPLDIMDACCEASALRPITPKRAACWLSQTQAVRRCSARPHFRRRR